MAVVSPVEGQLKAFSSIDRVTVGYRAVHFFITEIQNDQALLGFN